MGEAGGRWPFPPLSREEGDAAQLPGGTSAVRHKERKEEPVPPAKPVDPPRQAT